MSSPTLSPRPFVLIASLIAAVSSCALLVGPLVFLQSTVRMIGQVALALTIAGFFGLVAAVAARPRARHYLDQLASRGVELTAALPSVLACGVLTVAAALTPPTASATVIGIMAGLRCVRLVESAVATMPTARHSSQLVGAIRKTLGRILLPTLSTLVERIVGLEAAVAWVAILDREWHGGWGQCIGDAARAGDLKRVFGWTLATIASSVALKLLNWRYHLAESAVMTTR